jgi:Domain of unknown function (DUF5664)
MPRKQIKHRARSLKISAAPDAAAVAEIPTPPKRLLSSLSSAERKTYPLAMGLMDYFPDALAYVAHVSYLGNQKHNPGGDLHWARGKSMDHADCAMRHLQERGTLDPEGVRHTGQLAWRAMALLQEELESAFGLAAPRGAGAKPVP